MGYFIADIILEAAYLDNVGRSYQHLKLVTMRPNQIKYNVYFTIEEIVTNAIQLENGADLRK
jgi:hypothetical protein